MYYYLQMCISMEGLNDYYMEAYDLNYVDAAPGLFTDEFVVKGFAALVKNRPKY